MDYLQTIWRISAQPKGPFSYFSSFLGKAFVSYCNIFLFSSFGVLCSPSAMLRVITDSEYSE